jgi:DNA-binding transcriptional ArsR family regulator
MSEEQLEIETTGCKLCGKEIEYYTDDLLRELCFHCHDDNKRNKDDFRMTQIIISKVIYGEVSKADLKLLYEIIFEVAKQDVFASFELNQTQLAEQLKLQQSNISRSLKKLVKSGLLIKNENLYSFGISKIT